MRLTFTDPMVWAGAVLRMCSTQAKFQKSTGALTGESLRKQKIEKMKARIATQREQNLLEIAQTHKKYTKYSMPILEEVNVSFFSNKDYRANEWT